MRPLNRHRYEILLGAGFLRFEAKEFCKVPIRKTPYIDEMIKARFKEHQEHLKNKGTTKDWEIRIKTMYIDGKLIKTTKKGKTFDPWKLLRNFEAKFKLKHPEYQSPWRKRQKDWQKFRRNMDRALKEEAEGRKYPRGAAYS